MQSLLSDHLADDYWLVLDSSAPRLQLSLFQGERVIEYKCVTGDAVEHLIESVTDLLKNNRVSISNIDHFVYCQGPGSILGIRIAVMAIKTWVAVKNPSKPANVYSYHSLSAALVHLLNKTNTQNQKVAVTAEWKKNYWNVAESEGDNTQIQVWDTQKLLDYPDKLYLLPQKKLWTSLPMELPTVDYSIEMLTQPDFRRALLSPADGWPIYTPEAKNYAKWSGKRHRKQE